MEILDGVSGMNSRIKSITISELLLCAKNVFMIIFKLLENIFETSYTQKTENFLKRSNNDIYVGTKVEMTGVY
jgi:hypothetical protein